jgi:hypothetical protein
LQNQANFAILTPSLHMHFARLFLSSMALVLGVLILAISFSTANTALSSTGIQETSTKQFYMGETILPDHVAYPALMAMDRAKLEMDTPSERIYTQVEYSQRRFEYALALIEKDNLPLAISTLTKSQKYLFQAAEEALATQASPTAVSYVLKALNYYRDQLIQLKPTFSDAERPTIDQMIEHNQILAERLANFTASTSAEVPEVSP